MNEHQCPGGCGQMVPRARLACGRDWFRLPKDLRAAIRETFRAKAWAAHRAAVGDALDWYRNNPRPEAEAAS